MKKILTPSLTFLLLFAAAAPGFAAWDEGVSAFRSGRFDEAATAFRSVADASPNAPQGHYMLGLSLMRLGRSTAACEPLSKAVELQPESADYRMALAQGQLKVGSPGKALITLVAIDLATVDEAKRSALASLLAKAATHGKSDAKASVALSKALEVAPSSKPLWLARARVEERLGRSAEAFAALVAAYELDRKDTAVGQRAVRAAFALAESRNGDHRRQWYTKGATVAVALADTEPTPQNLRYAGLARMNLQDYDGALSWFGRAVDMDGEDATLYLHQARCLLAMEEVGAERARTALKHLDAALALAPDDGLSGRIWTAQGSAFRHLERFADAIEAYDRAGNEVKVAEMEDLFERQKGNKIWDDEVRRCQKKQRAVHAVLAESDDLKGTAGWRKIEKDAADALAECQPYLSEAG